MLLLWNGEYFFLIVCFSVNANTKKFKLRHIAYVIFVLGCINQSCKTQKQKQTKKQKSG